MARTGVGADVAGQLLGTAGQNAHRLQSEPAFAALQRRPFPASSGETHRLNRGGDRQANAADTVVLGSRCTGGGFAAPGWELFRGRRCPTGRSAFQ